MYFVLLYGGRAVNLFAQLTIKVPCIYSLTSQRMRPCNCFVAIGSDLIGAYVDAVTSQHVSMYWSCIMGL